MKIATWNVNGIRARATQLHEWLERDRPDVVCLQELKAELAQVPEAVQRQDYHAFWHCCKGYSGVSLQLRKDSFPAEPVYGHPPFGLESRAMDPDNAGLFTWWAPWRNLRARNIGWRLDYMLASAGLFARARSCVVQADVGTSDQAPLVMEAVSW